MQESAKAMIAHSAYRAISFRSSAAVLSNVAVYSPFQLPENVFRPVGSTPTSCICASSTEVQISAVTDVVKTTKAVCLSTSILPCNDQE